MRTIRFFLFLALTVAIGLGAVTSPAGAAVLGLKGGLSLQ